MCHSNPKWTHCTKDWCDETANKGKYGCEKPTADEDCQWNNICTFKTCQGKDSSFAHCTAAYCKAHPSDVQCWNPDDAEDQCHYGTDATKCTVDMCHANPTWSHCTKDWCDKTANKGKYGCATPTEGEKCTWDAKSCTYEYCSSTEGKTNIHCDKDYCDAHPSDVWCWNPKNKVDACHWGNYENCTPKTCAQNPKFDHCTKDWCDKTANKGKLGCAPATQD